MFAAYKEHQPRSASTSEFCHIGCLISGRAYGVTAFADYVLSPVLHSSDPKTLGLRSLISEVPEVQSLRHARSW